MPGQDTADLSNAVIIVLLVLLIWSWLAPLACKCGCRGWCRCSYRCPCKGEGFGNDPHDLYERDSGESAASTPQAIFTGAAAPGESVRTDYMTSKEKLEPARVDTNIQRFTVETAQGSRNEADEIGGDSIDTKAVTAGPQAWTNDPRDVVGLVRGATQVPLGSTDQLRKLLPYMGGD